MKITSLQNDDQTSWTPLSACKNKMDGRLGGSLVPPEGGAVAVWTQGWWKAGCPTLA